MKDYDILNPLSIELSGRHMIEASAGTGKTHNITRIYVRLLVEKKLSVQQILVMTFTEAATEEIKARIASFIDTLINDFDSAPCDCSLSLQAKVGAQETLHLLKLAQLELDLASIYTINGFCQRIIGRFGLSMSLPQHAELLSDFDGIKLAYLSDIIRSLRTSPDQYLLLENESLHDPVNFMKHFRNAIDQAGALKVHSVSSLKQEAVAQFNACWEKQKAARARLALELDAHRPILIKGTKTGQKANEALIDLAIEWVQQEELIPLAEGEELIERWLALGPYTRDDSKKIDDRLLSDAFKKLFSDARIKNYIESGLSKEHSLLLDGQALLVGIKDVGIMAQAKTSLKESINRVPFYELVYGIVKTLKQKVEQHKQSYSVIGFDDQIQGVANAMNDDGKALIESLQQEYPAALVDEFQDTDKHQYEILEHLYPKEDKARLLLMIGDPKQAIYSFRGGDIHTYMRAKDKVDSPFGMDVNYRSSKAVIAAYNRIFHGAPLEEQARPLFDTNIHYPIIESPRKVLDSALNLIDNNPSQGNAAFSFICANAAREVKPNAKRKQKYDTASDIQIDEILNWIAHEIKRLLADVHIEQKGETRLVKSEDIAILVRGHKQVAKVKKVLASHGIASVFLGERSPLFQSQQALHILWLLQAVHKASRDNVRRAISTGLVEMSPDQKLDPRELLLNDEHPAWEYTYKSLGEYLLLWQQKGVHALLLTLIQKSTLNSSDYERQLTNYMHIAELLAEASITETSPLQLIYHLHKEITGKNQTQANELRLESDQKLIKIITQHKSKGLEYPIVFLPFANYVNTRTPKHVAVYYSGNNNSVVELGMSTKAKESIIAESQAEDMRLLYVSLTRPILRCYLGVFSAVSCNSSALTRALNIPVDANQENDDTGRTTLNNIAQNLSDIAEYIFLTMADVPLVIKNEIPIENLPDTEFLQFNATVNRRWQVTSFSKLSNKFENSVYVQQFSNNMGENGDAIMRFERDAEEATNRVRAGVSATETEIDARIESPLLDLSTQTSDEYCYTFPKGPDAGTLLHDILEYIDFSQANIAEALSELNMHLINQHKIDEVQLSLWFEKILASPILMRSDSAFLRLHDLAKSSTLKEAEFYFPIKATNITQMANIVGDYRKQLRTKFSALSWPSLKLNQELIEGAMHGFIDLIFEYDGQYFVADYKSNYLGDRADEYHPDVLAQDIIHHNYDIQYLIYSVALHRYLQANLSDYDYKKHFGGVCYLYLRGMQGHVQRSEQGLPYANGVFYDTIDQTLLLRLHQLFADTLLDEESAAGDTLL